MIKKCKEPDCENRVPRTQDYCYFCWRRRMKKQDEDYFGQGKSSLFKSKCSINVSRADLLYHGGNCFD